MKTLKQFLNESAEKREALKKEMHNFADQTYQDVAPDLPREGNYHTASAISHIGMVLYDKYKSHPDFNKTHHNPEKIAKQVVKNYRDDDTAESKAIERKQQREYNKRFEAKPEKQPKEPKMKPIKIKMKRGIGSY